MPVDSFLPRVTVIDGILAIDLERLKYLRGILHEAGHPALLLKVE